MAIRVAIAGASGYSGAELTALAARHPQIELVALFSSAGGNELPFDEIHPALAGLEGPTLRPFDFDALVDAKPDLVFLATPNETSASLASRILDLGIRVVDLAGSFRLSDAATYPGWYGFDHPAPELLGSAVYGLTEWCNGELYGARLVANPGCYATSVLLALKPIADLLDPSQPIICDAKSGVSGAGKRADLEYSFTELAGNFKAYSVGAHRHSPEIREHLGLADGVDLVFVPHLLPTPRGILSTLYIGFADSVDPSTLAARYADAYSSTPFVRFRPTGLPELRQVVGTPRAEIGFKVLEGGRRAVIVSVLDNLLKGAASQAVQNFNRVFGFDEREGLA